MLPLKNFVKSIFSTNSQLLPEAISAYIHKLPDKIKVEWERDGSFIIGKVIADDIEFTTQGKGADNFIKMVNDALMVAYNIPDDYFDAIRSFRFFEPVKEELSQLKNGEIQRATIGFKVDKKVTVQVA